jgi:hypothetical protein
MRRCGTHRPRPVGWFRFQSVGVGPPLREPPGTWSGSSSFPFTACLEHRRIPQHVFGECRPVGLPGNERALTTQLAGLGRPINSANLTRPQESNDGSGDGRADQSGHDERQSHKRTVCTPSRRWAAANRRQSAFRDGKPESSAGRRSRRSSHRGAPMARRFRPGMSTPTLSVWRTWLPGCGGSGRKLDLLLCGRANGGSNGRRKWSSVRHFPPALIRRPYSTGLRCATSDRAARPGVPARSTTFISRLCEQAEACEPTHTDGTNHPAVSGGCWHCVPS